MPPASKEMTEAKDGFLDRYSAPLMGFVGNVAGQGEEGRCIRNLVSLPGFFVSRRLPATGERTWVLQP